MKEWPRLLVKQLSGSQDFTTIKFQKIEYFNKQPPESRVILKSLHKQTETIHSFRLSTAMDDHNRQRRKSESGGLTSSKISNIDLKYPKTLIQQHQFIDRVKDLRRRAIQGRMKSKFQKSYKKIDGGKPSTFNPQTTTQSNREKALASFQEIQVTRTFQRDRTYYQRTFEKMNSGLTPDSPSEQSIQFQKSQKKITIRPKWQQFVLLQINRYKPKSFEQLKRDSIINLLSDTKETMPNTPAVKIRIQHKLQPYFCIPRKKGSQKTCLTSQSQRIQTVL